MRVLLIEDDRLLAESLKFQIEKEGLSLDVCYTGGDGLHYMTETSYDLVILDRLLPGLDGLALLREARSRQIDTPVILLTALGGLSDKIDGLDAGADDYMVKPFEFGELMARIRSVNRRPRGLRQDIGVSAGDMTLFPDEKRLRGPGGECFLSKREAGLMEALLHSQGAVLTRQALLLRVWGVEADVEDGNLDNYIHFLRRRLRAVKSRCAIATVRGVGYRLEVEHAS